MEYLYRYQQHSGWYDPEYHDRGSKTVYYWIASRDSSVCSDQQKHQIQVPGLLSLRGPEHEHLSLLGPEYLDRCPKTRYHWISSPDSSLRCDRQKYQVQILRQLRSTCLEAMLCAFSYRGRNLIRVAD